ncbi:ArsC family reductase [Stappia sp. F7233]|uniref:ArsC family reductase n=1 Tax=Stappia albiluteola TaxID=2758565 RepID=A0A839AEC5_9HYPH|nr:ArsC family reductase [Stappia albiluteola]MBA5777388.1 ArsC family reductase [Stappia albiluteola]
MAVTVYGITNCDTIKKARRFLEERGVEYTFHDYRKAGVDSGKLDGFMKEFGWEKVLNRGGTTWRKLPDEVKEQTTNADAALALMLEQPSIIKRPIVETGARNFIGFDQTAWELAFEMGEFA